MEPKTSRAIWQAWNWKSALLSAAFRAPIFVATGFRSGWHAVAGAVLAEGAFRVVTSGFYGAIAQRLTQLRPFWKAAVVLVLVLPTVEQSLDFMIHRLRGTANLKWAMLTSCIVMAISAMFNWYAMMHGALLTGERGQAFTTDLKRLPRIVIGFVAAGPRALWQVLRRVSQRTIRGL